MSTVCSIIIKVGVVWRDKYSNTPLSCYCYSILTLKCIYCKCTFTAYTIVSISVGVVNILDINNCKSPKIIL